MNGWHSGRSRGSVTSCRWMCAEVEWVRFYLHITYPRRRVPHRCRIHFSVCVELNFRTITIYIMTRSFVEILLERYLMDWEGQLQVAAMELFRTICKKGYFVKQLHRQGKYISKGYPIFHAPPPPPGIVFP